MVLNMKSKILFTIYFWVGLLWLVFSIACSEPLTTKESSITKTPTAPAYYQGELSWKNMEYVLQSSAVGRFITHDYKHPYSVPVSFGYCDERIYIHSSPTGQKMENLAENPKVTFVVDRYNEREGWASVTISGSARIIKDQEKRNRALQRFSIVYKSRPEEIAEKIANLKSVKFPPMPMVTIEIIPDKVTSRLSKVPPVMMPKYPYMIEDKMPEPSKNPPSKKDAKIFTGVLPVETVQWLLSSGVRGRLNITRKTYPYSVPIDYSFFDGKIYVHLQGTDIKIDELRNSTGVSFSIDRVSADLSGWKGKLPYLSGKEHSRPLAEKAGVWIWYSINVFGTARVTDVKDWESDKPLQMAPIEIIPQQVTSKASHLTLAVPKLFYTFKEKLLQRD